MARGAVIYIIYMIGIVILIFTARSEARCVIGWLIMSNLLIWTDVKQSSSFIFGTRCECETIWMEWHTVCVKDIIKNYVNTSIFPMWRPVANWISWMCSLPTYWHRPNVQRMSVSHSIHARPTIYKFDQQSPLHIAVHRAIMKLTPHRRHEH